MGPRISCTIEARWQGNLQEVQVGMLVATLAGDDNLGHPFWIEKFLVLMKDEQGNQAKSIVVHWYHTSSLDAFAGKYSLEMVKDVQGTSRKRRRKNVPSTSTLTLDNVDILEYDFSLTKNRPSKTSHRHDNKREDPKYGTRHQTKTNKKNVS